MPATPSIHDASRALTRADLLREAGASAEVLNDAISAGVMTAADRYDEQALAMLRALVALDRHGIEPRHVRSLRQSVQREVTLVESALAPLLRRQDANARAKADEVAPQLLARLDEVRRVFQAEELERILRG